MKYIDFSTGKLNPYKGFNGSNGKKISILYNNELFMIKSSPKPKSNSVIEYTNSCISEYIGCHIYNILGIETQETVLGEYKGKKVVGCKDFTSDGSNLLDFNIVNNTIFDSTSKQNGAELSDVLLAIEEQELIDSNIVKERFWDMFIIDALLGNFDRHNGNWGFLTNAEKQTIKLAPVYDCGSCLYPQADESLKELIMNDSKTLDERIYVFPNSALKMGGKKINYFNFLTTTTNLDCLQALNKISARYNEDAINKVIENTPTLSELDIDFYKYIIKERKERILDYALKHNPNL